MSAQEPGEGEVRRFVLRQVMQNIRCGACGARYRAEDVAVVENTDSVWMLMAVCPGCDTQAMIMVVMQERPEFEGRPSLDEDDVLDLHSLLEGCRGDVWSLIGDE